MSFTLRDYQQAAIDAVRTYWAEGTNNCLVALPTGTGKTEVAVYLLKQAMQPGQRAIFMAHTDELIQQPLGRFDRHWPLAGVGVVKAEQDQVGSRIIIASVQTITRPNRLEAILQSGPIDYLVTDESHHSPCPTYRRIYETLREANPDLKHVGLTATPWRADGVGMIEAFDVIAYQKNILWAIREGWLVPPDGVQIETDVDISGVSTARFGDFAVGELGDVLDAAGWHKLIARTYIERTPGLQTLIYTPRILNSVKVCEELVARGVKAAHIDGSTPRGLRRKLVSQFRNREIQVLSNVAVVTEGFDAPSAEAIFMARPTKSHGLHTQIIGRGLRPFPGKEKCLVLLFVTTGARILTLFDLGKSKKLAEAEKKAEKLGVAGISEPIPLFDEMAIDGVGLYAKTVDLFGSSKGAWFRDGATFSLALGESGGYDRTLVILPPNNGDNWRLVGLGRRLTSKGAWADKRKAKYGPWSHKVLEESPDVEDLMIMATGIIERVGADIIALRSKKWRKDPASAGQLKYARKWASADVLASLTKGEVAQIITHGIVLQELRKGGFLC